MSKNTEHSSLSPFLYIAMLFTRAAPKVMLSILIFWPPISERDFGGIAEEFEPYSQ